MVVPRPHESIIQATLSSLKARKGYREGECHGAHSHRSHNNRRALPPHARGQPELITFCHCDQSKWSTYPEVGMLSVATLTCGQGQSLSTQRVWHCNDAADRGDDIRTRQSAMLAAAPTVGLSNFSRSLCGWSGVRPCCVFAEGREGVGGCGWEMFSNAQRVESIPVDRRQMLPLPGCPDPWRSLTRRPAPSQKVEKHPIRATPVSARRSQALVYDSGIQNCGQAGTELLVAKIPVRSFSTATQSGT